MGVLAAAAATPCWAAASGAEAQDTLPFGNWRSYSALLFNPFAPWFLPKSSGPSRADAAGDEAPALPVRRTGKTTARSAATNTEAEAVPEEPSKVILVPVPKLSDTQKSLFLPSRPCVRTPYKPPLPPPP